jgi:hypothetical protein
MRREADNDNDVLPDRLIIQIKTAMRSDTLEDIRDSNAESSKPAQEPRLFESINRSEIVQRLVFITIHTGINGVRSVQFGVI